MTKISDEDLIEELRSVDQADVTDCFLSSPYFIKAADRIEKLVESIKNLLHLWATVAVNREVSEGKLEKAVEALNLISQMHGYTSRQLSDIARSVLAELEKDT
jgi:hypothetical protein